MRNRFNINWNCALYLSKTNFCPPGKIGLSFQNARDIVETRLKLTKCHFFFTETPFPDVMLSQMNKIYSSQWLGHEKILTGSKDNKLILWDLSDDKVKCSPVELPTAVSPFYGLDSGGIHSLSMNSTEDLLVSGSTNPCELVVLDCPKLRPISVLTGHTDWSFDCFWLSDRKVLSVSRDKTICVWDISKSVDRSRNDNEEQSVENQQSLSMEDEGSSGNKDNISAGEHKGCNSDRSLGTHDSDISDNRNTFQYSSINNNNRLQSLNTENTFNVSSSQNSGNRYENKDHFSLKPIIQIQGDSNKIRKCSPNESKSHFGTLSVGGRVKIWDSRELIGIRSRLFQNIGESVCLDWNHYYNCLIMGTQCGIFLIDPRSNKSVYHEQNNSEKIWGIRSLSSKEFRLTIGTTFGKLMFMDIRKMVFDWETPSSNYQYATQSYLWANDFYSAYFNGRSIPHAIYTHQYDPTGTRLFTGGGPILLGLSGVYAAVW